MPLLKLTSQIQLLVLFPLILVRAQINNKPITPPRALRLDPFLAAQQLTHGRPRFWCEFLHRHVRVPGHVDAFRGPGALVCGRHAETRPQGRGKGRRGGGGETLGDFDEAVLQEVGFVGGGEDGG